MCLIAVIDYGVGNVNSIVNMLKKIGIKVILASNVEDIQRADKLILPGVGSYDTGMQKLKKNGLNDIIKKSALIDEKPLLGICLGMQMLGRRSDEGSEDGLSLIPFETKRFDFSGIDNFKIPHMGWNNVKIELYEDPMVYNLNEVQRYYFVHSYHAVCDYEENVLMRCEYGYYFVAGVKLKNIYGVQFHPEKSHMFGMSLLENFARRV